MRHARADDRHNDETYCPSVADASQSSRLSFAFMNLSSKIKSGKFDFHRKRAAFPVERHAAAAPDAGDVGCS